MKYIEFQLISRRSNRWDGVHLDFCTFIRTPISDDKFAFSKRLRELFSKTLYQMVWCFRALLDRFSIRHFNCFGEWTHTTTLTTSAAVQLPCHHRPSGPESPRWIFHLSSETVESTTNRLTLWYITWINSSRQPKFEKGSEDITPSHASWALLEPFMDWQIPKWTVNALRLVGWFYAKIHCGYYD